MEEASNETSKADVKRARIDGALRRKKMRQFFIGIGILAVVGLIGGYAIYRSKHKPPDPVGVSTYENQGQEHVPLDHQFSYNSNPPTSGPHYATDANWGVYDYEVNDKLLIHNLEHGGIWISYRPGVSPQVVEDLKAVIKDLGESKIVMAPRSANDKDVAVAAWTHLLTLDHAGQSLTADDKDRISSFYKVYLNRGPEMVPAYMPGIDPKDAK